MIFSNKLDLFYKTTTIKFTIHYKTTIVTNVALAMIVNYDLRVVIYDCKTFIVQVPEGAVPPLSRNGI